MAESTAAEPILSDAQMASYHENGYLVLPNVLSAQELAALRAAADALNEERLRRGGSGAHRCHTRRDLLAGSIHGSRPPSRRSWELPCSLSARICICSRRGSIGSP